MILQWKIYDWFLSQVEHYSCKLSNWSWQKRWNNPGTAFLGKGENK